MVTIQSAHGPVILHNNADPGAPRAPIGVSLTLSVEQRENSVGGSSSVNPPSRQVLHHELLDFEVQNDESGCIPGSADDALKIAAGGYHFYD